DDAGWRVVTKRQPDAEERADLLFAWRAVVSVKSNAIVLARHGATIGIGAGLGSDAFFPFRDGVDQAAEAGVRAIVQPGGSVRDAEVIAAADEHGMAM